MGRDREPSHIHADLSDDRRDGDRPDPAHLIQLVDLVGEKGQVPIHLPRRSQPSRRGRAGRPSFQGTESPDMPWRFAGSRLAIMKYPTLGSRAPLVHDLNGSRAYGATGGRNPTTGIVDSQGYRSPRSRHLHVEATKVGFPSAAVRVRYRSVGDSTPQRRHEAHRRGRGS